MFSLLKIIQHKDTEFMIAPMSDKRYLKNDDMKIFITMTDHRVEITNHVYNYNVKLHVYYIKLNHIFTIVNMCTLWY